VAVVLYLGISLTARSLRPSTSGTGHSRKSSAARGAGPRHDCLGQDGDDLHLRLDSVVHHQSGAPGQGRSPSGTAADLLCGALWITVWYIVAMRRAARAGWGHSSPNEPVNRWLQLSNIHRLASTSRMAAIVTLHTPGLPFAGNSFARRRKCPWRWTRLGNETASLDCLLMPCGKCCSIPLWSVFFNCLLRHQISSEDALQK